METLKRHRENLSILADKIGVYWGKLKKTLRKSIDFAYKRCTFLYALKCWWRNYSGGQEWEQGQGWARWQYDRAGWRGQNMMDTKHRSWWSNADFKRRPYMAHRIFVFKTPSNASSSLLMISIDSFNVILIHMTLISDRYFRLLLMDHSHGEVWFDLSFLIATANHHHDSRLSFPRLEHNYH